jgi:ligand-binding SRPBCC domain-containing protein
MVHVKDDGIFDAPLEKVWRFLQDERAGVHTHGSVQFTKVVEQTPNGMVVEMESKTRDGKSFKGTAKFTFNAPKGFEMEYLAGPQKGTKHTHTYTPMGDKTKVEVNGEFKFEGLDDESTRKAALAMLEEVFNEDTAALRKYK